jgi:beta-apo-4'-carotenal oxygenase
MVTIPEFVHTPIDKIPVIYNRLQKSFLLHKTRPLEWRLTQLRKLYWG